jgi:uncharacterized protein DUF5343
LAELVYTPNPASIPRFLKHIQSAGVPEKLTTRYLESVGFKSKNDRYVIGVMKALKFTDTSGTPQPAWTAYRDKSRSKEVLGLAIREAYADLYATYPEAHDKDTEALRNFFSARSKVADSTLKLAVATFKTLAGEATFDADASPRKRPVEKVPEDEPVVYDVPLPANRRGGSPSVNINIELHLPETDNADVYDKLFAALRKHLLD